MTASSRQPWQDQLRRRVKDVQTLRTSLDMPPDIADDILESTLQFRFAITPHWMELIQHSTAAYQQVVPSANELLPSPTDMDDPLGEERDSVLPNLVHRYPDRVLLLATDHCAAYCRYCTRKRVVGSGQVPFSRTKLQAAFDYIAAHPEIRDVLVSGGDPLILNDEQIGWILDSLRDIPHIEFLRMGTRVPLFMPDRITDELLAIFRRNHPFFLSVHFNHPDELTPETRQALNCIADAGVPMGSQTVLLRGINDDPAVMKSLMHELLKCRVRPYYIYQCDLVEGAEHFRTDIATGMRIIEALRGHTTGYAVPTFVVDLPGGGGKVPVAPDYVLSRSGHTWRFRNFEGREYEYQEPEREAEAPLEISPSERTAILAQLTERAIGQGIWG